MWVLQARQKVIGEAQKFLSTLPCASWLHWPASSPHSLPAKALPGQGYARWPQSPSLPCCQRYLSLLGVLVLTGVLVLPGVLGLPEVLVVPELLVVPEVLEPELPVVQEVLAAQQQKHALHLHRLPARWGFLASSKSGFGGQGVKDADAHSLYYSSTSECPHALHDCQQQRL